MVTVGLVWVNFCPALWVNYTPAVTLEKIKSQGYEGSASLLRMYIADIKRNGGKQSSQPQEDRISKKQLYSLLYRDPNKLTERNRNRLSKLKEDPKLMKIYTVVQDYKRAIKTKNVKLLESWIDENLKSLIKEFKVFAKRLSEDIETIRNALLYD